MHKIGSILAQNRLYIKMITNRDAPFCHMTGDWRWYLRTCWNIANGDGECKTPPLTHAESSAFPCERLVFIILPPVNFLSISNKYSKERVKPHSVNKFIKIFSHLKLCPAKATHNFKWLKITHITHLFNLSTNICKSWCLDIWMYAYF